MDAKEKICAQNWIEQFREDYYCRAGNMDCPIMDTQEVQTDSRLDIVIMDCLHWASCGDRRVTWQRRYNHPFYRIALSR